jgi:hypothetical protein
MRAAASSQRAGQTAWTEFSAPTGAGGGRDSAARRERRLRAGAAGLVAEAIGVARTADATGQLLVRADSAFYWTTVLSACRRAGAHEAGRATGPASPVGKAATWGGQISPSGAAPKADKAGQRRAARTRTAQHGARRPAGHRW